MKFAFLLALSLLTTHAHADRNIVYAARYYLPLGSRGQSYFHLYRINSDGTGWTQLTYGDYDDSNPKWSPNGHWIAFIRGLGSLCVVSAHGGNVKTLINDPDGDYQVKDRFPLGDTFCWLPNSCRILIFKGPENPAAYANPDAYTLSIKSRETDKSFTTFQDLIYNDATNYVVAPNNQHAYLDRSGHGAPRMDTWKAGKLVKMGYAPQVFDPIWLDTRTLLGLIGLKHLPLHYAVVELNGNIKKQGVLGISISSDGKINPISMSLSFLEGIPSQRKQFLFAADNSNSTIRPQYKIYSRNISSHTAKLFLQNVQFVRFKPQGLNVCTAPSRSLWNYGPTNRTVWAAPLMIGRYPSRKLETITPGLVWVTGADWRQKPA